MNDTITVGQATYTVEATKAGYVLRGPRNAEYGLIRHHEKPDHLFAVNLRSFAVLGRLGWFTDAGGTLRHIS